MNSFKKAAYYASLHSNEKDLHSTYIPPAQQLCQNWKQTKLKKAKNHSFLKLKQYNNNKKALKNLMKQVSPGGTEV